MKVIFSNCTQCYPFKYSASNTKMEFMSRGMISEGIDITVINDIIGNKGYTSLETGVERKIKYYIFPRKQKIIYGYLLNFIRLFTILRKEKKKNEKNILFCGGILPTFITQLIIGKILGYKCVFLIQEWNLAFENKEFINKISSWAACKLYGYLLDGIIPISHFLWDKMKHFKKPMIIVPILSDYSLKANQEYQNKTFNHFAYCAGASYYRVIKTMMDAYKIFLEQGGKQKMILIISGRDSDINIIKDYIFSIGLTNHVTLKTQIPYEELIKIYQTALALIIPLDPNSIADKARFSQKIAEYVSTKRPIITSNVGEIPYYFINKKNAIITDYTSKAYAQAMLDLAEDIDFANQIGTNGYIIGKNNFAYQLYGKKLKDYFTKL